MYIIIFDFETDMKKISYSIYDEKIKGIMLKLKDDDMNGWMKVPFDITKKEINEMKREAKKIKEKCDVFLVVGIGGSFLGAKMIINALSDYFSKADPEILFVGTTLSTDYLLSLREYLKDKDIVINVISKSGSTLETSLAFEFLLSLMDEKYDDYSDRIYVTTDKNESKLLDLAREKGYKAFDIPKDVGGRYSVLTAVGLLPVAVAGKDIDKLLLGARDCDIDEAIKYAILRHELYLEGKFIESFVFYEEKYMDFGEWLKQLFAETQGKENRAILPISTLYTRDLHSLGQYFQQGRRMIFETVINVLNTKDHITTKFKKTFKEINEIAVKAVAKAHFEDDVFTGMITLNQMTEYELGYLIYFFEMAAAIGGYLLNVNPFDQPGVSKYKKFINEGINKE